MDGKQPGSKRPPWTPSQPVRTLLQLLVVAALAGFGAYGLWFGHFRLPLPAPRHTLHHEMMRFDGDSALLMSAGSLILAVALTIVIIKQASAQPGVKADQTLPTVLAVIGFVMVVGTYWSNILHLV